jgi:transcriptional regulator with XRE-family HTH domain
MSKVIDPYVKTCRPPSPKPRNVADQQRGQIAQPRGHWANISAATLSRVENGHMPDLETFAKICRWLGKDPRDFLGFEKEESTEPSAVVHFRKKRTVSKETAIALGELILAAQSALRARSADRINPCGTVSKHRLSGSPLKLDETWGSDRGHPSTPDVTPRMSASAYSTSIP